MLNQNTFRYFLYSKEQYKMRSQIEKNMGKKFIAGKVLVKGKWLEFTEMSTKPDVGKKYPDLRIVHSGNISGPNSVLYMPIRSEWEGSGVR